MRARALLLLALLTTACKDEPLTPVRTLQPSGLSAAIVKNGGGLGDAGFDQWSAEGTYNQWPPMGWERLFPPGDHYNDFNAPCHPADAPPPLDGGWCNAGQEVTSFGIFTPVTPWDPTPGAEHIAVLATQDLVNEEGNPIMPRAVKVAFRVQANASSVL